MQTQKGIESQTLWKNSFLSRSRSLSVSQSKEIHAQTKKITHEIYGVLLSTRSD